MVDPSELMTELFGSMAVRTVNVREVETAAGQVMTFPDNGATGDYAHPHLAARSGHFYMLLEGTATLWAKHSSPLVPGRLVWFPRGNAVEGSVESAEMSIACDGVCRWIAGHFSAGNPATSRLLEGLPAFLELDGDSTRTSSVETLLPLIERELRTDAPGSRAMVNGAFHMLFIETLRGFIGRLSHNAAGWFRASLDPDIGPVLLLLHARPEEPWTVATMAEQALMSRSSFAAKFNELVGEPPLQYLTKYRMDKARMLLCDETQPVKEIARTVGYISEAAFSTAFRRTEGIAPGSVRKIARSLSGSKGNAAPAA